MTAAVASTSVYENASSTAAVVAKPTGTALGDLLLVVVTQTAVAPIVPPSGTSGGGYTGGYGAGYFPGPPAATQATSGYTGGYGGGYTVQTSDWSTIGQVSSNAHSVGVFYRYASAAEPSSYTFPTSPTAGRVSAIMARITGITAGTPLDGIPVSASVNAATTLNVGSITTSAAAGLLLEAYALASNTATVTAPGGITQAAQTAGTGPRTYLGYQAITAGATGSKTWTYSPTSPTTAQIGVGVAVQQASVTATRTTTWAVGGRPVSTRATTWTTQATLSPATRATTWGDLTPVTVAALAMWSTFAQTTSATFQPSMRLTAYAPMGNRLGPLPTPTTINVGLPLDDIPALTFSYPAGGANVSMLGQPIEVSVEISPDDGATWFEPPDGRFVYLTDGRDSLDPADPYAVECRGYIWRFSKATLYPTATLTEDGKRAFVAVTAGALLRTLFAEATARGALSGITYNSFTAATDSAGLPWIDTMIVSYDPGVDYLQILMNLVDQGLIDFRMQGRDLRVFRHDGTMARDRTVGSGIVNLRSGRDLKDATFQRTWEGLADSSYFQGDQGRHFSYTNVDAVTPWGRQEVFLSNGSITDTAMMSQISRYALAQTSDQRTSYTRTLDFTRSPLVPVHDYFVGDYLFSTVDGSLPDRLRLRQITLTADARGAMSGSVVLNDRFMEADIRAKRRVDGITNGASGAAPLPSKPPPDTTDKTTPGQVTAIIASSDAYLTVSGHTVAQVTLTWATPTTNSDGSAYTDHDHFEIYRRQTGQAASSRLLAATSPDAVQTLAPYNPGTSWIFNIRAVDTSGHRGAFSADKTVVMASDTTPPQPPSTPTATTSLGIVTISWNGNMAAGARPPDFDHVEVHTSTVNNFTPTSGTLRDRLFGAGSLVLTGLAVGVPIFIRLVAIDTSGLVSDPSGQATATPRRLVGTDLDAGSITYAQVGFKDPGNIVPDGSFETDPYRTLVLGRSDPAWQFSSALAYHAGWAALIDATVSAGNDRYLNLIDTTEEQTIMPTEQLFCRFAYNGSIGATGQMFLVVAWRLADGTVSTSTLLATTPSGTWQQVAGQLTAPATAVAFRVYMQLTAPAGSGMWRIDAVEVRRTVGTAIIQDAAITNAQIANLAVNDAKIANLSVGKLTSGTINATVLVAGTIRTAAAGARLELTGSGLRLYGSNNAIKGWWDPASGRLRIYNETDLSPTSTGHGLQFGDDEGPNLAIDNNEIMARNNGAVSFLGLNIQGGNVTIGGWSGHTLPASIPAADHRISLQGGVYIPNTGDVDYPSEDAPLIIGDNAGPHLGFDSNEILAADADSPTTLILNGPGNVSGHHATPVTIGSGSVAIRRGGSYSAGDRWGFIYSNDPANDVGIRFDGAEAFLKDGNNAGSKAITASAFHVSSSASVKEQVSEFDPLQIIGGAPSRRWQYRAHVESEDRWHYGPMLEDLPTDFHHQLGRNSEDPDSEILAGYDLAAVVGVLWEAVRRLAEDHDGKP